MKLTQQETVVISTEISCLTCEYKTFKIYDPAVTYQEFVVDKANIKCSECNSSCWCEPKCRDPPEKKKFLEAIKHRQHQDPLKKESSEEWYLGLIEKYWKLYHTIKDRMPILWDSLVSYYLF